MPVLFDYPNNPWIKGKTSAKPLQTQKKPWQTRTIQCPREGCFGVSFCFCFLFPKPITPFQVQGG